MLFEDATSVSERQLKTLLAFEHPLAELYDDWLDRDADGMDTFRNGVMCCANDILKDRAEEKYRDSNEPQYGKSWEDARACDGLPEWRANHMRNAECARMFNKGAAVAWQFTVNEHGKRDYFWGHYFNDGNRAKADMQARAADYKRRYIDPPELKKPTHGHDDR